MPSCSKPILPNSHQPKQNQAYSEIAKIKVNPTQVLDLLAHPVLVYDLSCFFTVRGLTAQVSLLCYKLDSIIDAEPTGTM